MVEQPDTPVSDLGLVPTREAAPRALCVSSSRFSSLRDPRSGVNWSCGGGDISTSSWWGGKTRAD